MLVEVVVGALTLLAPSVAGALIVDTDADVDDLGAIMFLLAKRKNLVAITVAGNGWSNQFAGAINVQRITQLARCAQIAVSYGEAPYTVLSTEGFDGQHAKNIPPQQFLSGLDRKLTPNCSGGLSWPYRPSFSYPFGAARLIVDTIMKARPGTVDFLELGTFTNLARAFALEPHIVSQIRAIYVSGGHVHLGKDAVSVDADSSAPGFYTFDTEPRDAGGQNFFNDAIAAHNVLAAIQQCQAAMRSGWVHSCPEVRLMLSSTQDLLPASTPMQVVQLCSTCTGAFAARVRTYFEHLPDCSNESIDAFRYWDESAALMAITPHGTSSFCTEWIQESVVVQLASGPYYSSLVRPPSQEEGVLVNVCTNANFSTFLDAFWEPFRRNEMPACRSE